MVQKFLKELSKDSGLAIYGFTEVKKALMRSTAKILIISECLENPEELTSIANKNGIKVEVISNETEEGEMIYKAFGGVICIARHF